jgi:peroxiredoxin Q/BCP
VGSVNLGASGAKVVYFYPKDNTSGCTLEAQEFGLLASAFRKLKVEVFGVSKDSLKSHEAFKGKLRLGFELLEDHSGEACAFFGVWVEKSMYGRKYHGIERATYLIGPDGHIHRAWRKVQAKGHAEEVLQAAREMMK